MFEAGQTESSIIRKVEPQARASLNLGQCKIFRKMEEDLAPQLFTYSCRMYLLKNVARASQNTSHDNEELVAQNRTLGRSADAHIPGVEKFQSDSAPKVFSRGYRQIDSDSNVFATVEARVAHSLPPSRIT